MISLVNNPVRAYLGCKAVRIADFAALLSTTCGPANFGLQGLIIGPLGAAMFIAVRCSFMVQK